jgi:hypothetical protein
MVAIYIYCKTFAVQCTLYRTYLFYLDWRLWMTYRTWIMNFWPYLSLPCYIGPWTGWRYVWVSGLVQLNMQNQLGRDGSRLFADFSPFHPSAAALVSPRRSADLPARFSRVFLQQQQHGHDCGGFGRTQGECYGPHGQNWSSPVCPGGMNCPQRDFQPTAHVRVG